MKKWIISIIVILVVCFAGYQWYNSKTKAAQQTSNMQVRTAVVQKGNFEVKVSGSGTVQPVISEDIKSPINNNSVAEVLVAAGDTVKKGQTLITFTDGSDPITAPDDGTITTLSVLPGERVQIGQTVAHLTNYSNFETVAAIDEMDIPKVSVGQTATVTVSAIPDQTFTGTVTAIANEGTSTNGVSTFNVTVHIDKPAGLKVGMSTQANILTASKDNALYVPVDAVHSFNGQKFVLLATNNGSQNSQGNQNGQKSGNWQGNQNGQGSGNSQGNQTGQGSGNWQGNQNRQRGQNGQSNFGGGQRVFVTTGLTNSDYVEITSGLTEGQTVRLPNLVIGNTTNSQLGRGGFGGLGGFGGGGMGRQSGGGGNRSGNGGNAGAGGRSGN